MKRVVTAILFILVAVAVGTSASAQQSSPYISDYTIDYRLGQDSEKRSTLDVVERITVEFPENRNKGIVREIPRDYDGHSLSLKMHSVTRNGEEEPLYAERNDGDLRVYETGTDDYINGTQVFEFKYFMRDVTKYFADNNRDEFYWDTNGTGWRASIEQLTASVTIDEKLLSSLSGGVACYQGAYGSSEQCEIIETPDGFSVSAENLAPGENVTMAIGFNPETFASYEPSLFEKALLVWGIVTAATSAIAVGIFTWLTIRYYRWKNRDAEMGTIVPEYIPPKNASVPTSVAVAPGTYQNTLAASLVDFAVRHYIRILETSKKSFWRQAEYDIEVIRDISDLRAEEQEILNDVFGRKPKVGERMALKKLQNSTSAYARFSNNDKKLDTLLKEQYKLKQVDSEKRGWFSKLAKILGGIGVVTLSPLLLVVAAIAFAFSKTLWVLSDEGLNLRRYLKGLEMYIKVAEKERLKMLQSPEGAEKVDIQDPTSPAQLVKLYERVLPYAVLFGQEKEWSKRLGEYYQQSESSPSWYTGNTAFNAAMFSSMMSDFSSSASATSASSSSSGGSSGGGFSGGGGGGGGGGFR